MEPIFARISPGARYWSLACLASVLAAIGEALLPFTPYYAGDKPAGLDVLPGFLVLVLLLWVHGLALPLSRVGLIGWTWVCLTVLQLALGLVHKYQPNDVDWEAALNWTPIYLWLAAGAAWLVGLPFSVAVMIDRRRRERQAGQGPRKQGIDWSRAVRWTLACVGSVVAVFVALSLPYEPNPADRGRDAGGAAAFAVVFAAPVFLVWLHGLALPRARIGPLGWTLVCLTLLVVAASTAHMPMYTGAGEIHSGPTPQELEELTGVAWLVGLPVAFVVMFRRRLLGPPASLPEPPG